MAKERPTIPPPVLTPPVTVELAAGAFDRVIQAGVAAGMAKEPAPMSPLAARAIANHAELAREYALEAAKLCATADVHGQARKNALRLLKLAVAHLEG